MHATVTSFHPEELEMWKTKTTAQSTSDFSPKHQTPEIFQNIRSDIKTLQVATLLGSVT